MSDKLLNLALSTDIFRHLLKTRRPTSFKSTSAYSASALQIIVPYKFTTYIYTDGLSSYLLTRNCTCDCRSRVLSITEHDHKTLFRLLWCTVHTNGSW